MSLDIAKKLIAELEKNEELKALFLKDKEAAIKASGLDCTLAEVKEASLLNRELDEKELDSISGGSAAGPGGCQNNWYIKECAATVEKGSWCGSNDWCDTWDELYVETTKTTICFGGPGIG